MHNPIFPLLESILTSMIYDLTIIYDRRKVNVLENQYQLRSIIFWGGLCLFVCLLLLFFPSPRNTYTLTVIRIYETHHIIFMMNHGWSRVWQFEKKKEKKKKNENENLALNIWEKEKKDHSNFWSSWLSCVGENMRWNALGFLTWFLHSLHQRSDSLFLHKFPY